MQGEGRLDFACKQCECPVEFGLFDIEEGAHKVLCPRCHKEYRFEDESLRRQVRKFVDLCNQIHQSEEILGNAVVGINVSSHQVEIPYKLLLTQLNSHFHLELENQTVQLNFQPIPV